MRYFNRFKEFDSITEFRLYNSFYIAIGMALITPIIISLKGTYMLPYIISIFAIIQTLSIKSNNYIVNKFSTSSIYKMGVIIHISFIFISSIYFYSPKLMIYLDSFLGIIEVAIFSSYSIALNNYLAKEHPNSMSSFQILRNSSYADGFLLGLGFITLIIYFSSIGYAIWSFIIFNVIFSIWLINNWRFYD